MIACGSRFVAPPSLPVARGTTACNSTAVAYNLLCSRAFARRLYRQGEWTHGMHGTALPHAEYEH